MGLVEETSGFGEDLALVAAGEEAGEAVQLEVHEADALARGDGERKDDREAEIPRTEGPYPNGRVAGCTLWVEGGVAQLLHTLGRCPKDSRLTPQEPLIERREKAKKEMDFLHCSMLKGKSPSRMSLSDAEIDQGVSQP